MPRTKKRANSAAARLDGETAAVVTGLDDEETNSPQDSPLILRDSANALVVALKVDSAQILSKTIRLAGWWAGEGRLLLTCDGKEVSFELRRNRRPDVAIALGMTDPPEGFGFSISTPRADGAYEMHLLAEIDARPVHLSCPLVLASGETRGADGPTSIEAMGNIESAVASTMASDAVLAGWVLHGADVKVWLETADGFPFSLDGAFRVFRQDVVDVHGRAFGATASDAGFIIRLEDVAPGQKIRLLAEHCGNRVILAEATCASMPSDAAAASRLLFSLLTPMSDMHRRLPMVDMPILKALADHQRGRQAQLEVVSHQLGIPVEQPVVSVIVPLYGRVDLIETQLIEFCRDPWFVQHAQLIYVLDDPKLVSAFGQFAEALQRIYKVPFQWVWGGANRGFSGANNLGAEYAKAANLLFLNSDVFPQEPGWLPALLDVLAGNERIGAVGPRLVFGNGAIQHAGMQFVRRDDLGIWVNHHPYMGLDPALDPQQELTIVPAVTGACLAMRRAQFDQVGGWDTGYLIGDFEDSDLCLKLRSAGFDIAYQPAVQLTHLERQSFKLLGEGDFRTRVVIHNAIRHQNQWGSLLAPGKP